jgi:putative PIN family toxin of toxin-antitoxin system
VKIVLDTNVLVSGLLTPFGNCGEIVRMLTSDAITLCVDSRILIEYGEVLNRPQFNINRQKATVVIEYIQNSAETQLTVPLDRTLPDNSDNPFMEVALSSDAECLVTGNLKHFPEHCRAGVRVLAPKEFLEFFRKRRTSR